MLRPRRRDVLKGMAASGLAASKLAAGGLGAAGLGALLGCRGDASSHIEGGIVDQDFSTGHRLRDGLLGSGVPGRATTPGGRPGEGRPGDSGRPQGSATRRKVQVLIAGGGVAGLAAAWRLRREGIEDLLVCELSDQEGGTARSGTMQGLQHPWGAHYLPTPMRSQRALVALLQDLDMVEGFDADGRVRVPMQHRVRAPHERLFAVGEWSEDLWLRAGASDRDRDELRQLEALVDEFAARRDAQGRPSFALPLASSASSDRSLDRMSAAEWAASQGLGGERMRWYLEYATRDDYGCRLADCSAWALLHYFCSRRSPTSGKSGEYLSWPEGNAFLTRGLARGLAQRLRTDSVVTQVRPGERGAEVDVLHANEGLVSYEAQHVVLALPQYVVRHVLPGDAAQAARARFRYTPWLVANLHLRRLPLSRGFPQCWDNVCYDSDSLGYVDATHQLDRVGSDRVWTWYLPLCDGPEAEVRQRMLQEPWSTWKDLVLGDLRRAHPDIDDCVTRIDVWRWGHAMVKPVPGFLWGDARRRAAARQGDVHFAHSDLAGLPLFEEAQWIGTAAAETILRDLGQPFEALAG